MSERHATPPLSVERWLWVVYFMIMMMVVVGGITRLTGSGLSMVEWRPLMGTLPPMSEAEWGRVFELYQASPQYQEVNHWMTLGDFKKIFFWEYLHRLLGRLIGLVFGLPWLIFTLTKTLRGEWMRRALVALILGGGQGLMGWYMVKSGLIDRPEVSHFRLAAHLSLAFLCGLWVLSLTLDLRAARRLESLDREEGRGSHKQASEEVIKQQPPSALWWLFPPLLMLQVAYGAFMAGKRAGYLYSTFPDMNGYLIGPSVGSMGSLSHDLLNNPDSIHTLHRLLAWAVLALGGYLSHSLARSKELKAQARSFGAALALQFTLGALTVVTGMNHALAVTHQWGAFVLLSATLWLYQSERRARLSSPNA